MFKLTDGEMTLGQRQSGAERAEGCRRGTQSECAVGPGDLHGRQRDKRGEGSRGDGGDPIVIEREQPH